MSAVFVSLLTFILVACSILLTAGDECNLRIVPASVRVSDLRLLGTHPPPIRPLPPRLDYEDDPITSLTFLPTPGSSTQELSTKFHNIW